jgi:hypothetical protein
VAVGAGVAIACHGVDVGRGGEMAGASSTLFVGTLAADGRGSDPKPRSSRPQDAKRSVTAERRRAARDRVDELGYLSSIIMISLECADGIEPVICADFHT